MAEYPSFKALYSREPIAGQDFDPDNLCQDDYEYFTGTGQYSDNGKYPMTKSECGRLGGLSTKARYGREHYSSIGRKGATVFHERYTLAPYGLSNYVILDRQTGRFVNYLFPEVTP